MLVRLDGKIFKHKPNPLSTKKSSRVRRNQQTCKIAPRPIVKKNVFYEVEKVIQSKIHNGARLYLVKWTGYGSDENSWIRELPVFFKNNKRTWTEALESKILSDSESESGDELEDASGDESEDEWVQDVEDVPDSSSDNDSDGEADNDSDEDCSSVHYSQIPSKAEASKKTKKLYRHNSPRTVGSTSDKEKIVMKALVALSAVVTAGYACDLESDSD